MSTLPLSPMPMEAVREYRERVMEELACTAWTIGDQLRDGQTPNLAADGYFHPRLLELAVQRNAISERYAIERPSLRVA